MPTKDEALKMAIESLEAVIHRMARWTDGGKWPAGERAIKACKEALEQQEQPLTDGEIKKIIADMFEAGLFASYNMDMFARAIEQAHGIENKE